MTKDEYERLVLESADEDGKINPPPLTDPWVGLSLLVGMYMKGLIEKRGPEPLMYNRGGPWYIGKAKTHPLPKAMGPDSGKD